MNRTKNKKQHLKDYDDYNNNDDDDDDDDLLNVLYN